MPEIKVTATELKNKASDLRQQNSQLRTAVNQLVTDENSLAGMWEGEAQKAFRTAFNNDKRQMDEFINTIEKYCQALEQNAQKYGTAEQTNLSTASSRTY